MKAPDRMHALDALRGLAALGVLIFHYTGVMHILDPAWSTIPIGAVGVRVFFVISGYVIIGSAMRSPSRGAFAWARFVRLYPAFLTSMILTGGWLLLMGFRAYQVTPAEWALNLTMVPAWFGSPLVDAVYWTLAYEIGFYAAVCAALPWLKGEKLLRAGRYSGAGTLWRHPGTNGRKSIYRGPVPLTTGRVRNCFPSAIDRSSLPLSYLPEVAGPRVTHSGSALPTSAARSLYQLRRLTPALWLCAASLPVLWFAPIVGWFMVGVVLHELGLCSRASASCRGLLRGVMQGRAMRGAETGRAICTWAGAISYPLYLLHCEIGITLILILSPLGVLAAAILTTGAMLALATLVHRMIERPAQRALKRWAIGGFQIKLWQPVVIPEMF